MSNGDSMSLVRAGAQIGAAEKSMRAHSSGVAVSTKKYHVLVERDEDGFLVGSVTELPGCHTQARTRASLRTRLRDAIQLYLEASSAETPKATFVAVETVEV